MTDEFNDWVRKNAHIYGLLAPSEVRFPDGRVVQFTRDKSDPNTINWEVSGGAMDWTESQDRRPAGNHVGFFSRGHYTEEMLVHAEDGTLLGKLITNYMPVLRGAGIAAAGIEEAREDLIKRMAGGFQI